MYDGATSLVIESSRQTALVLQDKGVLWRVNLLTGEKAIISHLGSPLYGLAIEPSGASAIITKAGSPGALGFFGAYPSLLRVDLATGGITTLRHINGFGVAVEEGGKTALVATRGPQQDMACGGVCGAVWRVKLVP